jgi:hypothetical protein
LRQNLIQCRRSVRAWCLALSQRSRLKEDPKDAIEFVREVVRLALWKVSYHENELAKAYANLGFAKDPMKRGDFDEEAERADVDSDGADSVFENVTQFACDILDDRTEAVEYHGRALKSLTRHLPRSCWRAATTP